ncbi:hypothetical protein [Capsulimonas corticalis]|uniref:hypothetical protein n=1 Tax=Capsulimonas corticalis TaxID=2219043 RepID=UPI000E646277|nr:hypothetical protein [Capsulimonas corticalis]
MIVTDPNRLYEFCDLYERGDLDSDTKFALMLVILVSLDDGGRDGEIAGDTGSVARIEELLRADFVLHFHTVRHWALLGESDLKETFPITPMMQRMWDDGFREEYRQWL